MPISDSKGGFYEDEFHHAAAGWESKYDDNVIQPSVVTGQFSEDFDNNIKMPTQMMRDKTLGSDPRNIYNDQGDIVDYDLKLPPYFKFPPANQAPSAPDLNYESMPLLEQEGLKITQPNNTMPFPDNRDTSTDFDSRFPKDMKSGILNDIKPQDPNPPLIRRISDTDDHGEYVGQVNEGTPEYEDWAQGSKNHWIEARPLDGMDPAEFMKSQPSGMQGSTTKFKPPLDGYNTEPGGHSNMIWLRKKPEEGPPMS